MSKKTQKKVKEFNVTDVKEKNHFATLQDLAKHSEEFVRENDVEFLDEYIIKTQNALSKRMYKINKEDFSNVKLEIINLFDQIVKPVKFATAYIGFDKKIQKAIDNGDETLDISADQLDMIVEFYSLITFKTLEEARKIEFVQKALNKVYSAMFEDRQYIKITGEYLNSKKQQLKDKKLTEGLTESKETPKEVEEAVS